LPSITSLSYEQNQTFTQNVESAIHICNSMANNEEKKVSIKELYDLFIDMAKAKLDISIYMPNFTTWIAQAMVETKDLNSANTYLEYATMLLQYVNKAEDNSEYCLFEEDDKHFYYSNKLRMLTVELRNKEKVKKTIEDNLQLFESWMNAALIKKDLYAATEHYKCACEMYRTLSGDTQNDARKEEFITKDNLDPTIQSDSPNIILNRLFLKLKKFEKTEQAKQTLDDSNSGDAKQPDKSIELKIAEQIAEIRNAIHDSNGPIDWKAIAMKMELATSICRDMNNPQCERALKNLKAEIKSKKHEVTRETPNVFSSVMSIFSSRSNQRDSEPQKKENSAKASLFGSIFAP
jgi:hypothetical protein